MSTIDHLLSPSLSNTKSLRPIHSAQSHFMVAFFGGPLGICIFGLYSVYQAGLLNRYRNWYALLFSISFVLLGIWIWTSVHGFPFTITEEFSESDIRKWGNRIAGLLMMGAIYLIQSPLFSVSKMTSEYPNPWKPGITSVVTGAFLSFGIVAGGVYVIA